METESLITPECKEFCERLWKNKHGNTNDFNHYINRYDYCKAFPANGNVYNDRILYFDDDSLFIVRCVTQYYLTKTFQAMKIDLNDPNLAEDLDEGNIGTPGRIAKIWTGSNIHDDRELGCGRWTKKPRLARFPNKNGSSIPITKRVDIISNCSHHFIPFSSIARPDSYAVISYIPNRFVLGISKLQRIANWISLRFWLQEDLCKALYDEVAEVAETFSVYVRLNSLSHGCETMRGSKSKDGAFTAEFYGGKYTEDKSLIPLDK